MCHTRATVWNLKNNSVLLHTKAVTTGRQLSGLSQDPLDLATIVAGIDVMDYIFVNLVEFGSSQSLVREVSQDMCISLEDASWDSC